MRLQEKLDILMSSGVISGWDLQPVDANGNVGMHGTSRNTEQLTLLFPSGDRLVLGTFCSGSNEDSAFVLGDE